MASAKAEAIESTKEVLRGTGEGGDRGEEGKGGCVNNEVGEGGGPGEGGFRGRATGGGGHVTDSGTDTLGKSGLLRHWHLGGNVEGSGVYFKSPSHSLHCLPQLPPQITGRL